MRRNLLGKKGSQNFTAGWSNTYLTDYTTSVTSQHAHSRSGAALPFSGAITNGAGNPGIDTHWVPLTDTTTNPVQNSDCVAFSLAGMVDAYLTENYTQGSFDLSELGGSYYYNLASYPDADTTDTNLVSSASAGDGTILNNGDSFDVSIAASQANPVSITGATQYTSATAETVLVRLLMENSPTSDYAGVEFTLYGTTYSVDDVSGGGRSGNMWAGWSSQAKKNSGQLPDVFEFYAKRQFTGPAQEPIDWSMEFGVNGHDFDGTVKEIHFDQSDAYRYSTTTKIRFVDPTHVHVYNKATEAWFNLSLSNALVPGYYRTYFDWKDDIGWNAQKADRSALLHVHGLLDIRKVLEAARSNFSDSTLNANDIDVYFGVGADWTGSLSALWEYIAPLNDWSEQIAALGWGTARIQCSTLQIKSPAFDREFTKSHTASQTFERQVSTSTHALVSVGSSPYNTNKSFSAAIDVDPSNGFVTQDGPAVVFGAACFRDFTDTHIGEPTGLEADRLACGDPETNSATYTGSDVYGVNSGTIGFPQSDAGNEWYGREWRTVTFVDVQEPAQDFETSTITGTSIGTLNPWSNVEFFIGYYS